VAIDITVPEVGEGVDSIEVVKVLVKAGDEVEVDQPIVELETGKAAVEVPATDAGYRGPWLRYLYSLDIVGQG
jgi:pyruvate dehydrogenase E2 component (dihydrolipoamide acetyltransferase)